MSGVVAVIDYGMGNLHSVASALQHVGADRVMVTHDAQLIRQADRVVFRVSGPFATAWRRSAACGAIAC